MCLTKSSMLLPHDTTPRAAENLKGDVSKLDLEYNTLADIMGKGEAHRFPKELLISNEWI